MSVIDDGQGMDKEDLLLCIEAHATSKISSASDLYTVTSCGFRGEALASIAEVSRFEIISRSENSDKANNACIVSQGAMLVEAQVEASDSTFDSWSLNASARMVSGIQSKYAAFEPGAMTASKPSGILTV